jgi:general stress protein YciG
MANEQNLKPFNEMTEKEQREIARKGGKASGEARAKRKTLKEELLLLLAQGNTQEKISLSLIQEAMGGNTKAFEVIRDTVGEKPVDKLEADVGVTNITIKLDDEE